MWKSEKFARFDKIGAHYSYTLLINIIPAHFSYMSMPSRTFDGIWLFLHEVSWCQNCFVCAFLCLFSKFFIISSLHARHAGLPTTPICSHVEEEEKRLTSWLFPFWRLDVPVWMGERIFAVHALFIRNWSTVLQHRAMVSTCRIHGPIFGHWHSLNLCVFSQWKPRFPHGKTDPVSIQVTWPLLTQFQQLGCCHMWWTPLPGTRLRNSWSINCHFVYPETLVIVPKISISCGTWCYVSGVFISTTTWPQDCPFW